jgi:hypothetical protein
MRAIVKANATPLPTQVSRSAFAAIITEGSSSISGDQAGKLIHLHSDKIQRKAPASCFSNQTTSHFPLQTSLLAAQTNPFRENYSDKIPRTNIQKRPTHTQIKDHKKRATTLPLENSRQRTS